MSDEDIQPGFTGHPFFEELLRKFIAAALLDFSKHAQDPNSQLIDDMFVRFGSDIQRQIKRWFAENQNVSVQINFPRAEDLSLPFIAIINANESEGAQSYLGDYGGVQQLGGRKVTASSQLATPVNVYGQAELLPDNRPHATEVRKLISIPENKTTQLWIAAGDANGALYMYTVVKMLLVMNKMDFDRFAGARNMKMSGSDLQFHEEWMPQLTYMKQLTLNYEMNFEILLQKQSVIAGVNLSLREFLNGGVATIVE